MCPPKRCSISTQMATDPKPVQRPEDVTGKPLPSTRREQLLAQAKLTQSFEPTVQRNAVSKLMFESVLSGACTPAEILGRPTTIARGIAIGNFGHSSRCKSISSLNCLRYIMQELNGCGC